MDLPVTCLFFWNWQICLLHARLIDILNWFAFLGKYFLKWRHLTVFPGHWMRLRNYIKTRTGIFPVNQGPSLVALVFTHPPFFNFRKTIISNSCSTRESLRPLARCFFDDLAPLRKGCFGRLYLNKKRQNFWVKI